MLLIMVKYLISKKNKKYYLLGVTWGNEEQRQHSQEENTNHCTD